MFCEGEQEPAVFTKAKRDLLLLDIFYSGVVIVSGVARTPAGDIGIAHAIHSYVIDFIMAACRSVVARDPELISISVIFYGGIVVANPISSTPTPDI